METAVTPSTLWARVAGGARRQGTGQLCQRQTGRVRGSLASRWSPNNGCVCVFVSLFSFLISLFKNIILII